MRQFEMILHCPLLVLDWVVVNCQVRLILRSDEMKKKEGKEDYWNSTLEIKGNLALAFRCNDTAVVTPD